MKRKKPRQGGLVWSSSKGKTCPGCEQPVSSCTCAAEAAAPEVAGPVRVTRETKGRKGKGVTLVTGVPLPPADLAALAKKLKKRCGSGGTVKDGVIEVQGDHRETLTSELRKLGLDVP